MVVIICIMISYNIIIEGENSRQKVNGITMHGIVVIIWMYGDVVAGANESSNKITPEFIGRWFIP